LSALKSAQLYSEVLCVFVCGYCVVSLYVQLCSLYIFVEWMSSLDAYRFYDTYLALSLAVSFADSGFSRSKHRWWPIT
jgi:hypothetical protein